YLLLTGELPFRGNTRMLLHQVLHEEPKAPRSLNDRIPRDLETISLKAMSKEPGRRYESASGFADDLRRWLKGEPIKARPVGGVGRRWRWSRRTPSLAGSMAAAGFFFLTATILATLYAWNERRNVKAIVAEQQKTGEALDTSNENLRRA